MRKKTLVLQRPTPVSLATKKISKEDVIDSKNELGLHLLLYSDSVTEKE